MFIAQIEYNTTTHHNDVMIIFFLILCMLMYFLFTTRSDIGHHNVLLGIKRTHRFG